MCRIAGFWDFQWKGEYELKEVITRMRDTMVVGGPDDAGLYVEKEEGLALGHRRLSILDLSSAGHQPMQFEHLVLVYNGEVYNFREIRKNLEKKGYSFLSGTDTEVVLKTLHCYGLEGIEYFRGMFALALWDREKKELTLVRDRIGVKPLYWAKQGERFFFASELKALMAHPFFSKKISPEGLSLFLQYGYITSPHSIFEETYKLPPGHFLRIHRNGEVKVECYWSPREFFTRSQTGQKWQAKQERELLEELEHLLEESFRLRLIADVPVGIFLSGGVDSSTVAALLSQKVNSSLRTFTIGFYEQSYNEAQYAKQVAEILGCEHTELYCTPREAFEVIPKLPELYDEPFGDPSAIPTYLVSKLAKEQVKVCLSADGGDEQFFGYSRYHFIGKKFSWFFRRSCLRGLAQSLVCSIPPELALQVYQSLSCFLPNWPNFRDKFIKLQNSLKAKTLLDVYDKSCHFFLPEDLVLLGVPPTDKQREELILLLEEVQGFPNQMMLYDLLTYLPDDILVKVDRATMGVSLEGRDPFLDHHLLEFSCQLPFEWKYRQGKSKYLLRKILYRYLPSHLVDRPKQGFGVPIYEWFQKDLKKLYLEYLSFDRIQRGGIFSPKEVERLLKDYFLGRGVNPYKLWLLFVFELWRERWM